MIKNDVITDVLVIGAGGAGLTIAKTILEENPSAKVDIVAKEPPTRAHTGAAQGGVAAVLDTSNGDSIEAHIFDTVKGSDYLGDQDAIKFLCENAPRVIRKLDELGANFSRTEDGEIAQRAFGGHSYNRTCYARDTTGHIMLQVLYEQALKMGIETHSEWYVVSLIVEDNICRGIVVYDLAEGKIRVIQAKAVVLATGGYGRAFDITSNAYANTGDGVALTYRAGIPLEDMEFVQFHPTGVYKKKGAKGTLVTEGARGEGGYLLNSLGERFMKDYAPEKMELAPRDLVSRSIQTEINEGRGCGPQKDHVFLSIVHLGEEEITKKLPQIREITKDLAGVDPVKEPIPIQPTAHYSMGGIPIDLYGRVIGVGGLFAAGECACSSVHGANRLGSNSLLETVVFGEIAGKNVAKYVKKTQLYPISKEMMDSAGKEINTIIDQTGTERVSEIKTELQKTMSKYCGVFRDKEGLETALYKVRSLKERFFYVEISDKSMIFNTALVEALELNNLLTFSEVIVVGALARKESRGAHWRTDFPTRDDEKWLKHTMAHMGEDGRPKLSYKPVVILNHEPQARVY